MIMGDKLLLKIWWGMSRIIWRGREGYDLVVRILKPGEPSTKENRGGGGGGVILKISVVRPLGAATPTWNYISKLSKPSKGI